MKAEPEREPSRPTRAPPQHLPDHARDAPSPQSRVHSPHQLRAFVLNVPLVLHNPYALPHETPPTGRFGPPFPPSTPAPRRADPAIGEELTATSATSATGDRRDGGRQGTTGRKILLSPPVVGPVEREMLLTALESGWIAPAGPDLTAFEDEVAHRSQVAHGVALSSGTAALHLCLHLSGVGPGDEVLVPSFTFAASVNPVVYLGATPVFVDSSADTWTIDPALVAEEIVRAGRRGRPPKALVAVDVYGQCADYDPLREICFEFGVALIEDAAEALGSRYRANSAGSLGTVSALSFNGNKIITCGGGGMLLTDDATQAGKARHLATQARDPAPHYEHSVVGYNYRLSNLLAAVGRAQLRTLDERVAARRRTNALYREALSEASGLSFMPEAPYGTSNHWLTCLLIDPAEFAGSADEVRRALAAAGIEARPTWKPIHCQIAYQGSRVLGGSVSETLFAQGLCLPSGFGLTPADVERVTDTILAARHARPRDVS